MANGIGITKGLSSWQFQSTYVERAMDNAAYQAAHPDDTLVLAGPARKGTALGSGTGIQTLLAIGMLQSISFTQTKPTQPLMAIGSGRSFFVSGKSQTQWSIARLFINGRNLLRVLYHNAVAGGADPSQFDDKAALKKNAIFFINLDSELYYIPFGLGAIFRNKSHDLVGSFYAELCMINSYAIGINAGQNMVLENVTGLSDRLLPWHLADGGAQANMPRATLDEILDFQSGDANNPAPGSDGTMGDDTGSSTSA
jgi:hypothetical protein